MIKPLLLLSAAFCALAFVGCTTTPMPVTSQQQLIANGVDDAISIGLVPVLVKNANYIGAANALADALGAFSGATFTSADTDAMIAAAKAKGYAFSPTDEKAVVATINAAWARYAKNYQSMANNAIRPDVKLFIGAVADGIHNAAAQAKATQGS